MMHKYTSHVSAEVAQKVVSEFEAMGFTAEAYADGEVYIDDKAVEWVKVTTSDLP